MYVFDAKIFMLSRKTRISNESVSFEIGIITFVRIFISLGKQKDKYTFVSQSKSFICSKNDFVGEFAGILPVCFFGKRDRLL